MKKYNWERPWAAKGIEASVAVKEFEKIKNEFGSLTPESLLEYSKDASSIFYPLFEWDNEAAAHKHRLQQARLLINNVKITIISDGETQNIGAYEIIRDESGGGYKNIEALTQSDVEYVKESTMKTLKQISSKMKTYRQFDNIVFELNEIVVKLAEIGK